MRLRCLAIEVGEPDGAQHERASDGNERGGDELKQGHCSILRAKG
jgi:hypothetical protein